MSEHIKRVVNRKWPKEVAAALTDYYPGEDVLIALAREVKSPSRIAMMLRLAAVEHLKRFPNDARRQRSERMH